MEGVLNMAINPKDDYESLAKLLYPSIEASGNVYYGQTRKLTLDEVFDKNGKGFHSRIESQYNNASKEYSTFFCWDIGPLNGVIKVPDILPALPMCFAKYKLVVEPLTKDNEIHSGNFKTYERNVTATFDSIKITRGKNPINTSNDWDGTNFYVNKEGTSWYVYISIKEPFVNDYEASPLSDIPEYVDGDEFTIKPNGYVPATITLRKQGDVPNTDVYQYFIVGKSTDWENLVLDSSVSIFDYEEGEPYEAIKLRYKPGTTKSQQDFSNYLHIEIDAADVVLSGDMRSMQQDISHVGNYEFIGLFRDNESITSARNCKLYSESVGVRAYGHMFAWCTSLKDGPDIKYQSLGDTAFSQMFKNCTSLEYACDLGRYSSTDESFNGHRFWGMFEKCTSLKVAPNIQSDLCFNNEYFRMFAECTSLEFVQPVLRATKSILSDTSDAGCTQNIFNSMFYGCTSLKVAPTIIMSYIGDNGTFGDMFSECSSLKIPPRIVVNDFDSQTIYDGSDRYYGTFENTFYNCENLKCSPIITLPVPYKNGLEVPYLYNGMFSGCSSLNKIYLYSEINIYHDQNLNDWVSGVAPVGDFYYDTHCGNALPEGVNGIPEGWAVHDIYELYSDGTDEFDSSKRNEYLVTSGADSDYNGRGKLLENRDIESMGVTFDQGDLHPVNTYNQDGSYNQEVWGYKTFNSPVKFNNGIYTDELSVRGGSNNTTKSALIESAGNNDYASFTSSLAFSSDLGPTGFLTTKDATSELSSKITYNDGDINSSSFKTTASYGMSGKQGAYVSVLSYSDGELEGQVGTDYIISPIANYNSKSYSCKTYIKDTDKDRVYTSLKYDARERDGSIVAHVCETDVRIDRYNEMSLFNSANEYPGEGWVHLTRPDSNNDLIIESYHLGEGGSSRMSLYSRYDDVNDTYNSAHHSSTVISSSSQGTSYKTAKIEVDSYCNNRQSVPETSITLTADTITLAGTVTGAQISGEITDAKNLSSNGNKYLEAGTSNGVTAYSSIIPDDQDNNYSLGDNTDPWNSAYINNGYFTAINTSALISSSAATFTGSTQFTERVRCDDIVSRSLYVSKQILPYSGALQLQLPTDIEPTEQQKETYINAIASVVTDTASYVRAVLNFSLFAWHPINLVEQGAPIPADGTRYLTLRDKVDSAYSTLITAGVERDRISYITDQLGIGNNQFKIDYVCVKDLYADNIHGHLQYPDNDGTSQEDTLLHDGEISMFLLEYTGSSSTPTHVYRGTQLGKTPEMGLFMRTDSGRISIATYNKLYLTDVTGTEKMNITSSSYTIAVISIPKYDASTKTHLFLGMCIYSAD